MIIELMLLLESTSSGSLHHRELAHAVSNVVIIVVDQILVILGTLLNGFINVIEVRE